MRRGGEERKREEEESKSAGEEKRRNARAAARKREKETRRREALIRPSGSLSPSSCILLGEYRLSVVRLGVLHSSKYLGIFEESRVPKKTVYAVA